MSISKLLCINFSKSNHVHQTRYKRQQHERKAHTLTPVQMSFQRFEDAETNQRATPVLIMHGLFASKSNWTTMGRKIAKQTHRRIYNVDVRNHGDSPHSQEQSWQHLVADIFELMRNEKLEKISLMGHSMGGRALLGMALTYGEYVESLLSIDTSIFTPKRGFPWVRELLQIMMSMQLPQNLTLLEAKKFVKNELMKTHATDQFIELAMRNVTKSKDGKLIWALNLQVMHDNVENILHLEPYFGSMKAYNGPAFFICGKYFDSVPEEQWGKFLKWFPNAKAVWLEAGHIVHADQPKEFLRLSTNFFKIN